jgi:hypothetical protein
MLPCLYAAVFTLATFASALEQKSPADKYEGKIVSVAEGKVTLMKAKGGETLEFKITSATVIVRNGKPAQLKEIMADDKAEITATGEGKDLTAKTLTALTPE